MEDLVRFATVSETILKIIRGVLIAVFFVVLIGGISVFLIPYDPSSWIKPAIDPQSFSDASVGYLEFALAPQATHAITQSDIQMKGGLTLLTGSLIVAFGILVTQLMISTVREVRKGDPFSRHAIRALQLLGVTTIVGSVLTPLLSSLASWSTLQATHLIDAIMASPDIASVTFKFEAVNGFMILIGVAILLFAKIFEYGAELQTLSDETL